ncbi:MAG: baseplate J/gp47 family protein [Balneolaceae bacterium]|nr:baseplate J/gp47 family protein [Balneolaceae bacterium]
MYSSGSNSGTDFDQFYHCYPFGTQLIFEGSASQEDVLLLPTFVHGKDTEIDHSGEFLIGFSGLQPPQQLSLLFKMAEGSGDPTLDPPPIHWFYLSEEGWQLFESADIVKDTTNGLLDSGIIRFSIPQEATSNSSLLPGNLYWIKAAVNDNAGAVSRIIDVHAQALTAEFKDQNNDPNFLNEVLPAQTIGKLKNKQSEIKKILQPYASEGGKVAEQDEEYYRRVNERLRHKDRGISVWDYERLVLQQFPSIYKAKCINHSVYGLDKNGKQMNAEFAPGYVTLVVVPDLRNKQAFNPLNPKVSLNLLQYCPNKKIAHGMKIVRFRI